MLKIPVIASHITNLTDARYFAAWGVEYLLFNLNEISIDQIKSIKEWVEGVRILLEFGRDNIHLAEEAVRIIDPKGIGFYELIKSQNLKLDASNRTLFFHGQEHILAPTIHSKFSFFIRSEKEKWHKRTKAEKEEILASIAGEPIFLSAPFSAQEVQNIVDQKNIFGIVIEGTREERVGYKSFEELDSYFELLEA